MRLLPLLLAAALLSGCGFKGPLYLPKPAAPKPPAAVKPEPSPDLPAPAESIVVPQ